MTANGRWHGALEPRADFVRVLDFDAAITVAVTGASTGLFA